MVKKPKRKNLKPPRKCIFCEKGGGNKNPMSREHIWPEWMHRYLPQFPVAKKDQAYRIVRMGRVVETVRKKPKHGQPYTKTLKVVCKNCNETWMNTIEDKARDILVPLLQGIPITLRRDDCINLATWIALKVIVIENENPTDAVIQQPSRTAFMRRQTIPRGLKIWIFTHGSQDWYISFWHRAAGITLSTQQPLGRLKNMQSTALGVGHLLTFTTVSTNPQVQFEFKDVPGAVRRLWPLRRGNVAWPLAMLSNKATNRIADSFRRQLAAPNMEWRPLYQ